MDGQPQIQQALWILRRSPQNKKNSKHGKTDGEYNCTGSIYRHGRDDI